MFGPRSQADRLEEIAAALDAGLPPTLALAAGGIDSAGSGPIADSLGAAWKLKAAEIALLAACEEAGRLSPALRRLAATRAARLDHLRELIGRLAYPLGVLALAFFINLAVVPGGRPAALALGVAIGITAIGSLLLWSRLRAANSNASIDPIAWPLIGEQLRHRGDAPYLDAMAALHGAGVPIQRAHSIATTAVPFAAARARHFVAGQSVERGEPLAASLANARALGPAPLSMIANAERIGALESAFERGGEHERGVAHRALSRFLRAIGSAAYLTAVLAVAWTALRFYGGLLGGR